MSTLAGAPDARAQLAALLFAVLLLDEDGSGEITLEEWTDGINNSEEV